MKVVGSVGARRIAILTTDDAILPEIQEWLASSFHTTLLNSWDELQPLLEAVELAAVVADIETSAGSSEDCLKLLQDLRNLSSDLVLVGLTRSRSKTLSSQAREAGLDKLFVAPVAFQELQGFLAQALEDRDFGDPESRLAGRSLQPILFLRIDWRQRRDASRVRGDF